VVNIIDVFHCCRWWKKKKSELRKKRDNTNVGRSSHPQTDKTKSKGAIDRPSRAAQVDPKRGFRSSVVAVKIERPSRVKRKSSDSHQLAFTKPLSRSIEAELTSGSESESSTESLRLERESELVKKSTNKQKQYSKTKVSSKSKQKRESPATPTAAETSFKKRYILFLGNLPRDASQDDIINHFSKRGVAITELRLLTDKESGKSKGCAFAEFSGNKAMQSALKFHRSKLQGRTINVEVTCGGGGKGNERLKKIRERNRTLRRATTVKSGKVMKSKIRT
jgi:nucleolar protein 6